MNNPKWLDFQDVHKGATCLIIGNGPSLKDVPIKFLRSYPTFGSNRIYLLDGFSPTYYACVNPLVCGQSIDEINKLQCIAKFIRAEFADIVSGSLPLVSTMIPIFSKKPFDYVYEGFTVTFVLLQLAYYMGFARVGLVGVDHKYIFNGTPNAEVLAQGDDPNHFDPHYFSDGTRWNNPDLRQSEIAYGMARRVFENDNREIINLTPNSVLDIFKKQDINEWI